MTETERIVRGMSGAEIVVWRELFGYWPPVPLPPDRWAELEAEWERYRDERCDRAARRVRDEQTGRDCLPKRLEAQRARMTWKKVG